MNDPNVMEQNEIGGAIETGFKMLTDSSFSSMVNAEGLSALKKLLRLLLQGTYSINTKPVAEQPSRPPIEPKTPETPIALEVPPGGNGSK